MPPLHTAATPPPTAVDATQPFRAHGLDLQAYGHDGRQVSAPCPFCGGEANGRFAVLVSTGEWNCAVCGAKGNAFTFLRLLHAESDRLTTVGQLTDLALDRKILDPMTLQQWGAARSFLSERWVVPGWNGEGKLTQLYRWIQPRDSKKRILAVTTGMHHALHGVNLYQKGRNDLFVNEGFWDGCAFWEAMRGTKATKEGGFELTGSEASSLLSEGNVVAVPGAGIFQPNWAPLFAGKRVYLLYHNDHDKDISGRKVEGAGYAGMRKTAQLLSTFSPPPASIHFLRWGKEGASHDPDLPSGYDVRDYLSQGKTELERAKLVGELLKKVVPIPEDWIGGRSVGSVQVGGARLAVGECQDWRTLTNACRKAMNWIPGLYRGMATVLASIVSVKSVGDPLWIKLLGPPSTGKTTIAEAVSVADKYVYALSTLTGFHSGFKTDRHGDQDHGLLPKIKDKTLIVKDADTILSSPSKDKILSEARDLYDNVCRTHYANAVSREYNDHRTTIVLCGTKSLHALDGSELGERFLDSEIMDSIDTEIEAEVARRKVYAAWNQAGIFANGTPETNLSPAMIEMKRLTGGYVNYLRENAERLVQTIVSQPPPTVLVDKLIDLGTFVAYIRARPSKRQDEGDDREFAPRLCSQLTRLPIMLAAVLSKDTVDKEILAMTRQTALDTARGRTYAICKHLYESKSKAQAGLVPNMGLALGDIALQCNSTEERKRKMMRFLRKIGAVEPFRRENSSTIKWRLTPTMKRLWESVVLEVE